MRSATRNTALLVVALLLLGRVFPAFAQENGPNTRWIFPAACQGLSGTCCPAFNGLTCGGNGVCGPITASNNGVCDVGINAIAEGVNGAWWLTELFTNVCLCRGHFWGADCSQCAFGWTGAGCNTPAPTRVRQAFNLLTTHDQNAVLSAFVNSKRIAFPGTQMSYFDYYAGIHSFAAGNFDYWNVEEYLPNSPPNYAHSQTDSNGDIYWGTGFLSWHRHYLLMVEQMLAIVSGNSSFALPYWDWTKTSMLSNANLDLTLQAFGGNGQPSTMSDPCLSPSSGINCGCPLYTNPFNANTGFGDITSTGAQVDSTIRRLFGGNCFGGLALPTPQILNQTIAQSNFGPNNQDDGFSIDMEFNLHGTIHDWVGGSMMLLEYAASDPIFYLHHCFVDLAFERWLRLWQPVQPGSNVPPTSGAATGHNLYDCLGPMFPLTNHSVYWDPSWKVGYTYDQLPGRALGAASTLNYRPDKKGIHVQSVDPYDHGHRVVQEPVRPLHCHDLFQNADEAGVDCGGDFCRPC